MKRDSRGDATPGDVRRVAMNLLARREHARAELERKLDNRGFDSRLVQVVLDELACEGLQSDTRFAESLVASAARRGTGPAHARMKLRQCGVDADLAQQAMDDCDADWVELAAAVRARKFGDAPPDDYRERAKQARFLQQRGFDSEIIFRILGDL